LRHQLGDPFAKSFVTFTEGDLALQVQNRHVTDDSLVDLHANSSSSRVFESPVRPGEPAGADGACYRPGDRPAQPPQDPKNEFIVYGVCGLVLKGPGLRRSSVVPSPAGAEPVSNQWSPERLDALNRLTTTARLLSTAIHETGNALQVISGQAEMIEAQA